MSAFHGNKKIFKRKEPKPLQDPMEKYRLRLFIGRKTGRLDLATKVIWPVKNGSDYQEPAQITSGSQVENDSSFGEGSSQELKTSDKENNNNADNDLSVEGHDQLNAPLDRDSLSELRPGSSNAEIRNLFADLVNTGGGGVSKQVSFRGPLNQESDSIKQLSSKQLSTRSGFDNGNDNFVDDDKSVHSVHSDFHEKEGAVVIPTSLPPSQEIEFRLNVFPPEIVKISGKEFFNSVLKVAKNEVFSNQYFFSHRIKRIMAMQSLYTRYPTGN
jgi:hypothetical protein